MMVAYYQHDIAPWMDGTESLSDGEYRAYHVICQLIYLQEGPIVFHEPGLAGRCNQHVLAFRKNFQGLVNCGKLFRTDDGKISNRRVENELRKIAARRAQKVSAGKVGKGQTPTEPPANPRGVEPRSSGGHARKSLENQLPGQAPALPLDSGRKEPEDASASSGPAEPVDVRSRLFSYGVAYIARVSGKPVDRIKPIVGKWLRDSCDDGLAVLRAIEDADRNCVADPVSWIAAALGQRGMMPRRTGGNAFARMALQGTLEEIDERSGLC